MGHQLLDRCPCCGYRTGCTTCPVCFWTDDGRRDGSGGTQLRVEALRGDAQRGDAQRNGRHRDDAGYGRHRDTGRDDVISTVREDGPNGDLSLSAAQLNFALYGASHPRYQAVVRAPRVDEMP